MDRLTDATELLDGVLDDPATLAANLRDLRRINDRLGGVALSAAGIDAVAAHRTELSLLDVGTGGADIPVALLERAAAAGRQWSFVGLDSRPEVLAAAVLARPELALMDGLQLHVGDGTSLPYPDDSFDVVHCSLVVHHCTPDEAVILFREMARVARLGVVVNDLDRRWLGWLGAMLIGHLLTRNRYTRHDAPLSVRRAYRPDEMVAMLRAAGLAPVRIIRGSVRQRYAIAAVAAVRSDTAVAPGARDHAAVPDPIGAGE